MIEYLSMNRFYYKLGLFTGFSGIVIGVIGFFMRYFINRDRGPLTYINYLVPFSVGLLVVFVTFRSKKRQGMRYYSKQFQTMLLYILGALVLVNSGDMAGIILFLLGLVLAYRYSFLARKMLVYTALSNCLLLVLYAVIKPAQFNHIMHEILFVVFTYSVFYFIYSDFRSFLERRFRRLNKELDLARMIIPFGDELKRRIEASGAGDVEFTRKEYEVMVAICVHEKISNEELTGFMNISNATVKTHLNNIYRKTGIHSRSRLVSVYRDIFIDRGVPSG